MTFHPAFGVALLGLAGMWIIRRGKRANNSKASAPKETSLGTETPQAVADSIQTSSVPTPPESPIKEAEELVEKAIEESKAEESAFNATSSILVDPPSSQDATAVITTAAPKPPKQVSVPEGTSFLGDRQDSPLEVLTRTDSGLKRLGSKVRTSLKRIGSAKRVE
jgi:hypothetical protein